jgi:hypothetical protein
MMRSGVQIGGGVGGGRHHKVNYNSACDLDRFEKFKATMLNLAGLRKLAKLLATIIKEIPNILPCESVGIFISNQGMIANKQLS